MNFTLYRKLLRSEQWYKNLVIFLPLLFAETEFTQPFTKIIIGFIGFCALSSVSYIINDWIDRKKDALHPIKKTRPIAAGKIKEKEISIVVFLLIMIVVGTSRELGTFYTTLMVIYAISSTLYSFGLKNIPLVDLILISFHFVLRMLGGMAELPTKTIWLYFLTIFTLILFFLTHKRRSDYKILEGKNLDHKPVLKFYTKKRCYSIRTLAFMSCGVLWYFLYSLGKLTLIQVVMMGILLVMTNVIFSQKPLFVLKPYYLLKLWYWDGMALLTIGSFWLSKQM